MKILCLTHKELGDSLEPIKQTLHDSGLEFSVFEFDTVLPDFKSFEGVSHLVICSKPETKLSPDFHFICGFFWGMGAKLVWLSDASDTSKAIKLEAPLYFAETTLVSTEQLSQYLKSESEVFDKNQKLTQAKNALLEKGYPLFDSVFADVVLQNNLEIARLFLVAGFSPAISDPLGTPVLSLAVRESLNDMISLLIDSGAPVNQISKDRKYSALMDAVQIGNYENAKLLLEHGANPDFQSEDGQTALILAVGRQEKELVKLLLEHGADPNLKDKLGMSAIKYAQIFNKQEITKLFES